MHMRFGILSLAELLRYRSRCNFLSRHRRLWLRASGERFGSQRIQNELRLLPRPGRTWKRSGKGLPCRRFSSPQVQAAGQDALPASCGVIAEGRGNMPPFGTRLTKDQIDALVKYIRTLGQAK